MGTAQYIMVEPRQTYNLRVSQHVNPVSQQLENQILQHLQSSQQAWDEYQNGNVDKAQLIIDKIAEILAKERLAITPLQSITSQLTPDKPPIRIHSLGRFEIIVSGKSTKTPGKNSPKPLELLKCLIAFGGRKVSQEKIMGALWPDAAGDKASGNFRTTLHRLRKLLQYDNALIIEEGRLTLDNRYVWVDVWEMERKLSDLEHMFSTNNIDTNRVSQYSNTILSLYQGPFLGREAEQPWLLPLQEKLRNRMLKLLRCLGAYWEKKQHIEMAISSYNQAIEIDPLLENTYQKLMCLYASINQRSEALSTYQRCRKALSTTLGITPSNETVSLYKRI